MRVFILYLAYLPCFEFDIMVYGFIMSDNIKKFSGPTDIVTMHLSEMLVVRHFLTFDELDIQRQVITSPDGHRRISTPPFVDEANKFWVVNLMDARAIDVIARVALERENKIAGIPKFFTKDGFVSLVDEKQKETVTALINSSYSQIQWALADETLTVIDNQYPIVNEIDMGDLEHILLALNQLKFQEDPNNDEGIIFLTQKAVNLFQSKIDYIKVHHTGAEWLPVKIDHGLAGKLETRFANAKIILGMITDDGGEPKPVPE